MRLLLQGVPQGSGIFLAIEKSCQGPSECLKILFYFHTQYMDAACLAFCSKFSPQILLGIHCGSQCPPVCVCVSCRLLLCYKTGTHTHKYREVHAHPPIHTRVYIYFNLMPWAIYYCADIIQTQWQWQWRGASSDSLPATPSLSQCRTSKRKWKMENVALCAYLWLLLFGGALSRRLSTPHWAGDDCRLQVATSVWGGGGVGSFSDRNTV